jgi:predicted nuclease of predicted toxin-antitoxin system
LDGSETKDSAILAFVDANDMLLISGDFRDTHFLIGTPARVLRVTLGNLSNTQLIELVEASWASCFGPTYVLEINETSKKVMR